MIAILLLLAAGFSFTAFVCGIIVLSLAPPHAYAHPMCGRCKYNLRGLTKPKVCPECGVNLNRFHIIEAGDNKWRRKLIAKGVALIALSPLPFVVGYFIFMLWMMKHLD